MSDVSGDYLKYGVSFIITNDYNMYYRDPASILGKGGERCSENVCRARLVFGRAYCEIGRAAGLYGKVGDPPRYRFERGVQNAEKSVVPRTKRIRLLPGKSRQKGVRTEKRGSFTVRIL